MRSLKVEKVYRDSANGYGFQISPKIRLQGDWLERAGFAPGSHVLITETAPGRLLIEARVFER